MYMPHTLQKILILLSIFVFAACSTPPKTGGASGMANTGQYRVVRGDTLTKIARQHKQTVNSLMTMNNIKNPNSIKVGQVLNVKWSGSGPAPSVSGPAPVTGKSIAAPRNINLVWPAQGQSNRGTTASNNQGVYIKGKSGSPIKAAAAGTVAYTGDGLRGYGNMIIINHDANFLSVYAHNDKIMVSKDARVKQGQQIATMGNSATNAVQLYFELRYNGKPVDALRYLPKR